MNLENAYLSDEELNALIWEIEQNDLVMAPPDIKKNVLRKMVNPQREYVMYCFRVITSVAAAIIILLLIPQAIGAKEDESEIPSKEEVLKTQEYISREEALHETDFVHKILQNIGIFDRNIVSAIFMNENGGE